jgi:hypothetical protein
MKLLNKLFSFKIVLVYFCFFSINFYSQCNISESANLNIRRAKINYYVPDNYFCINAPDTYFDIYPEVLQSEFYLAMVNRENQIMICIATIPYPKGITKAEKFLIETVDLNHISKKALAQEMDTRLSQLRFVKTDYLKKINADRGYVYNTKVRKGGYLGIYPRCKKVIVYKDNVGRAEILFFYKYGQDALVKQEIERTWGLLKFK